MAFNHQSSRCSQRGLARTTSVSSNPQNALMTQNSTNLSNNISSIQNSFNNNKPSTGDHHQQLHESYSLAAPTSTSSNSSNNNTNQSSNINTLFANLFSSSSAGQQQQQNQQTKELNNTQSNQDSSNASQPMLPPSSSTGAMGQVSDGQLALRNLVTANSSQNNKQRQPMCPECEKSLPNQIVFDKIEAIIKLMQDEQNGVPVRTAKSFMSKIPSVFTGVDLIQWMMKNLKLDDQMEALHLANLIASHGYIFPIEDHTLSIKNDCTFYRFQTPCLWPSNTNEPENTDYAVYLCKRTMQGKTRLELADYEAENLARLQKMFSRKWEFIFMQAESQAKVDKKRDKLERKVLDSQERAFWDVYRPVPGCVNTTEIDIKKACRLSKSSKGCPSCHKIALASTNSNAPSPSVVPVSTNSTANPATTDANNQGNSRVASSSSSPLPQAGVSSAHQQLQQVTAKSVDVNDCNINQANTTIGIKQQTLSEPQPLRTIEPTSPLSITSSSCPNAHHHSHPHAHSHAHNHPHNHPHHHHHHHQCQHHHQHHQHHHHQHSRQHQNQAPPPTTSNTMSACHADTIKTAVTATPNVASSLNVAVNATNVSTLPQRSPSPSNLTSNQEPAPTSNKESFLQQTAKRLSIGHHSIGGRKSIDCSSMGAGHHQRQRIKSAAFVSTDMDIDGSAKIERQPCLKTHESCDDTSRRTSQIDQLLAASNQQGASTIKSCTACKPGNLNISSSQMIPRKESTNSHTLQRASTTSTSQPTQHGELGRTKEGDLIADTVETLAQIISEQIEPSQNKTITNVIIKKVSSLANTATSAQQLQNIGNLEKELELLKIRLDRRIGGVKMSKVTQSYLSYFQQWAEYDPFITTPIPSNPWITDSTELWDSERQTKDVHCRRIRRWAFSLKELLNDPAGRDQFFRFLEKEFSAENLKFWDAVQELKRVHSRDVARRVEAIWNEYLAPDANCPINIDSKSYETSKKNMEKNRNNRYIFDEAAGHVYQLMKNDSYPRYLRSDMYKDYKEASEKKRSNQASNPAFKNFVPDTKITSLGMAKLA